MANHPGGPAGPAPSTALPARGGDPRTGRAVVGPASALRGQLSAREDLWIEGQLDGEVQAPAHQVTVSPSGRVRAEIKARSVVVEGELHGNVVASQMVTVRAGGRLTGDIHAPRVGLEEGCQFQGHVDMDGGAAAPTSAATEGSEPSAPVESPALVGEGSG